MPNIKYRQSAEVERNEAKKECCDQYLGFRTAGSKSRGRLFKLDVGRFCGKTKKFYLLQIKTSKGWKKCKKVRKKVIKNVTVIMEQWNYV